MADRNTESNKTALARLKRDIAEKTPGRLYLFSGEEAYLREYYLRELKKAAVEGDENGIFYFSDKNWDAAALEEEVMNYPMLSERKLIIVEDFDIYKPAPGMKKFAEETLADLPDFVCLVFHMTQGAFEEKKRNKKAEENVAAFGLKVDFERPPEKDLIKWILRRFEALGKECTPKNAEKLARMGGGFMYKVLPEIEKIAAFTRGRVVGAEEINAVATAVLEVVIYNITDEIAAGRPNAAIRLTDEILRSGSDGPALVVAIGRAIRQMYNARLVLDESGGVRKFMEMNRMKSQYVARRVMEQAGRFPAARLRRGVIACGEAEDALLHSPAEPQIVVESLILALCRE